MPATTFKTTIDAAHFIPGHPKCGRLHGHTYTVDITIEGELRKEHPIYLIDFADLKAIVHILDHKTMVPNQHKEIKISEVRESEQALATTTEKPTAPDFLLIDWTDGSLKLRPGAVAVLPCAETSSELICEVIAGQIGALFADVAEMIDVKVSETANTSARCVLRRHEDPNAIIDPNAAVNLANRRARRGK